MKEMSVKIYFTENVLATSPNDEELMANFIAKNAPDAPTRQEEIAAVGQDEVFEKGTTVFPRTNSGLPMFWDYQWKGYFKEKCAAIKKNSAVFGESNDSPTSKIKEAQLTKEQLEELSTEIKEEEKVEAPKKRGRKKKTDDAAAKDEKKPISASIKAFKKEIDLNIFVFPRKIVIKTEDEIGLCQRPLRAETAQGPRVCLSSSEEIHGGATCEFYVQALIDERIDAVREWLDYGILHGTGQWRNSGAGRFLWAELDENGNQIGGNYTEAKFKKLRELAEL